MKYPIFAAVALLSGSVAHAGPFPVVFFPPTEVTTADLGTLGGTRSEAYDINDRGMIVGWADDSNNVAQAFYYLDGDMTLLDPGIGPHSNVATGINNHDQIVGNVEHLGVSRAFYAEPGSSILALLDSSHTGPGVGSVATAISDSGLMAGTRDIPGSCRKATIWTDLYTPYALGTGCTDANDVNVAGDAVGPGSYFPPKVIWHWTKDKVTVTPVPRPDYAASCKVFFDGEVLGINNPGSVVGYVLCENAQRAIYWNGHSEFSKDVGLLPKGGTHSVAEDINDDGFVVGYANGFVGGGLKLDWAFLFHPDFGMVALRRPRFTAWYGHCRAKALNQRNVLTGIIQVVGHCDTEDGSRSVRWDVIVPSEMLIPPLPYPP